MYELKPECAKEFNLYFYHFSRAEQSKVIGKIKAIKGKDWILLSPWKTLTAFQTKKGFPPFL